MANSPARSSIDVGTVIADTYTIEALIGRGGMGAVFLASHKRLPGKQVAIKVLHTDAEDEEILLRFKREAEIASRLGHPNIVGVSDFNVTADGTPYLVLEYLTGESLAARIKAGPIPIEQVFSISRQIGSALAAAHREGIVHRDLKPQNIFLVPTEVDGRMVEIAKVLDFGISKIRGSQTVKTQESSLLGTPQYMAPEQATGQHTMVDERTDIFALGAIVYEMLVGHPAFSGASIPEVVFKVVYEAPKSLALEAPGTPDSIVKTVEKAMAKPADERFPTVNAFIESLTGTPLSMFKSHSSIPIPDLGFADGSHMKKSKTPSQPGAKAEDGFANTVGSGDHGAAAADALGATVDSQRGKAASTMGTDVTMAPSSGAHRTPSMPPPDVDAGASTVGTGAGKEPVPMPKAPPAVAAPVVAAPVASRKPMGMMIGLALVCVAAAAVAVVFATRGGGTSGVKVDAAIALAAPPVDAMHLVDTDVAVVAVDAAQVIVAVDATTKPDAVVAVVKDAGGPRPPSIDAAPAKPSDPEVASAIKAGEAALKRGDEAGYLAAVEQAHVAIVHPTATDDDRQHANAITAIAHCMRQDSNGRAAYRQSGKYAGRVKRTCDQAGFPLD